MTNPITPEAVERFDCHGWDVRRGRMLRAEHGDYVRASDYDALARELAELKAERDALAENRDKLNHAYREGAVAGHEKALATARAQIVAAQEDMKERAANVLDHHGYGYGAVARALGNRLCCDGNMCGCQGADVGSYLQYLIRALPLTDPADALAEHDRAVRADERAKCAAVASAETGWDGVP